MTNIVNLQFEMNYLIDLFENNHTSTSNLSYVKLTTLIHRTDMNILKVILRLLQLYLAGR